MNFTAEYVTKNKVIEFINDLPFKPCEFLSEKFLNRSRELKDNEDNATIKYIYNLLGNLCSLSLVPSSTSEPFRPFFISNESRSAIIDDFQDDELLEFAKLIDKILNPELRARLTDLLWLKQNDFKYAQIAVDSYLQCVQNYLKDKKYSYAEKRIERCLNLSISLGRANNKFRKSILYIKLLLRDYKKIYEDEQHFIYLLIYLLNQKIKVTTSYASILSELSEKAMKESHFEQSRRYLELSSKIYAENDDHEKQKEILTKVAESFIKHSELSISKMVAGDYLINAIEVYRRIGDSQKVIEELHEKLLIIQKEALSEMGRIRTPVDLRDEVKHAIEQVSKKSKEEAIIELSLLVMTSNLKDLESEFENELKTTPLKAILGASKVNSEGKIIGKKPSLLSSDPEEAEEAKMSELFSNARFGYFMCANGFIEPARKQIMKEHNLRIDDLSFVVNNNPFIPEGREYIYAKGLFAGFEGDYFSSTHILVPQIENSVRYILTRSGIITSNISTDGIQDEKTLKIMLLHEKTKEIFGEDIIFDLRCILIERYGINFRNELAHGLIDYYSFYRPEIVFLWGLILKLCCLPILYHEAQLHNDTDNKTT